MPETPAQKYVEVHGKSVEDWIARYIEAFFGRVEMGAPRAVSEFGVVYDTHVYDFAATQDHELMMLALKLMTTQSMPPNPKNCTLVWRSLPQVFDRSPDFETDRSWPNTVRVRYRCHTIEGTSDTALNALKATQVAKEWEQSQHGQ